MNPFERKKDKVAICGFASTTRDKTPWNDDEYEIWILNEEANFEWCKRYDRAFQMHPRWNFTKPNNPNDPNHFYWLRNLNGICNRCNGTKKFKVGTEVRDCGECNDDGMCGVDPLRKDAIIYMQESYDDIPNSVKFPLKEISEKFNSQMSYHYYTSSVAFALVMAMYLGFKRIEIYGVEMKNNTEYGFQRANMEYWIGLARGMGYDVYSAAEEGLLHGELYGYASLKIGYRQDLEARARMLDNQAVIAKTNMDRYGGRLAMIEEIAEKFPNAPLKEWRNKIDDKFREFVGSVNFVNGAIRETKNLTELFDDHFLAEIVNEEKDR